MSPRTAPGDLGLGAYVTLGSGARSWGLAAEPDVVDGRRETVVRGLARLREANEGLAIPGLLGSVLADQGIESCVLYGSRPHSLATLVAMNERGKAPLRLTVGSNCSFGVVELTTTSARKLNDAITGTLAAPILTNQNSSLQTLALIVPPQPSPAMDRLKDELTPLVMAEGRFNTFFHGPMHTLTSDTTRRIGLVSNEDVAPTILHFFHIPVPSEMNGSPIRIVHAPPPFRMHARHLENRRTVVPLSVGIFIAVSVIGFVALGLVLLRRPPWTGLDRASLALPLFVQGVAVATLAAGSLPVLTYAWLVPFLVLSALAGALLGLAVRRRGPLVPAALVCAGVISFFVVEALRGWPDTLFPVLGGSALDGARFFGLPNTYIGLLLGAGIWLAAAMPPYAGFALLFGLGLFAGFPDLGADVGGALTMFAAAALWFLFRVRRRLRWQEALVGLVVVVAGMALVFAASVLLTSEPTHASRLVEGAGTRSVIETIGERLSTSWRLLTQFPLTWIIVAGLPICLWLALRAPSAFRPSFEQHPEWRDAMVILVLASIVAFVGNDTGAAAAGFGFGLAIAGILYLPLAERAATPAR
jgi:hypothetical protein